MESTVNKKANENNFDSARMDVVSENARFYNTIDRSDFEDQAKLCGLLVKKHGETDRCVDLEEVDSLFSRFGKPERLVKQIDILRNKKARRGRVLVVGAGFGREIQWLTDHASAKIDIYAFDNAQANIDDIQNRFTGKSNLKLFLRDVLDPSIEKWGRFDLILWMWSGIPELDNAQKQTALSNLASCLKKDGILIVESLDYSVGAKATEGVHLSNENPSKQVTFEIATGEKLKLEFVSRSELKEICVSAGLKFLCEPVSYLNGTRQIFFMEKANI